MEEAWLPALQIIVTAAVNVAFALMTGSFAGVAILARADSDWGRSRVQSLRRIATCAVAACLTASLFGLWILAAVMSEQPMLSSLSSLAAVLMQTHAGHAAALGTTALAILLACLLFATGQLGGRRVLVVAAACSAAFAASRASAGHAGATGALLPMITDWVHLLSASTWAGIVMVSALDALREPGPDGLLARTDCKSYVANISTIATATLAGVVVTGMFSSWRALDGSLTSLVTSTYGAILLVKVAGVGAATALGAHNRFVLMPRLFASVRGNGSSFPAALRRFTGVLGVESFILFGVLALAAALSTGSPPGPR